MKRLVIATRGSALARWQAEHVAAALRALEPGVDPELRVIKTRGDKILDVPLAKVGGKGLFVKEIEEALRRGAADLAVHSIKDVPAELAPGLELTAIPQREDPRDVLVSDGRGLSALARGARVGTSSLRRRAQLLRVRPDVHVADLRGNVDTRLRKLREGQYDAVILAAAGLVRLGLADRISEYLEVDDWLPAAGQGALGIETRRDDTEVRALVARLHDPETGICVAAERALLARLGGGCQVPIAAHARLTPGGLALDALLGHPSGAPVLTAAGTGQRSAPEALGRDVADELLARGGARILDDVRV